MAKYLDPEKTYTEKQLAFLEAMAGPARGNIRSAIKMAGYGEGVNARDVVPSLQEELVQIAEHILATHAPQAAFGITGVLDDPTALGAKNAVRAAKEVLDRVGVVKKEKMEVTTDGSGIFILPPKNPQEDQEEESSAED